MLFQIPIRKINFFPKQIQNGGYYTKKREKIELFYFLIVVFSWKNNENYIYYSTKSAHGT